MKLRQKLAMVLATAMVVTAVPVVTFADSKTTISKIVTTTDTKLPLGNTAPVLKVDLKDEFTGNEFYLQLEGAEWDKDATTEGIMNVGTFERLSKTEAKISIPQGTTGAVEIKLSNAVVKADEAIVIVDSNNTEVSDAKVTFARKQEGDVTVKAGTAATFYTGVNDIANIEFEETVGNQIKSGTYEFELSLDTDDYEFVNGTVKVEGTRGLKNNDVTLTGKIKEAKDESAILEVTVAIADGKTMSRGGFTVKEIAVEDTTDSPTIGEVKVEVAGYNTVAEELIDATDIVVAEVSEYGSSIVVTKKDDKLVEVGNGQTEKVTFELKETTKDSFANRDVDFILENGFFDESVFDVKTTDKTTTTTISVKVGDNTEKVEVEKIYKDKSDKKESEIIGFRMGLVGKDDTKETYKFTDYKVSAPINAEGDMTLKVEGRGVGTAIEAVIATINNQFTVDTKAMNVEVGVKGQKGGKIVLKEKDKGTFERGEEIIITLPADRDLSFKAPKVSATGDMRVDLVEKDDKKVIPVYGDKKDKEKVTAYEVRVKVERASKEASEIVIEDFEVSTDRAAADGTYEVKVGFAKRSGTIKVEDFFTIGEGITTKTVTTITNGATEMMVNGEKVTLDAPAYIKNDKMMAPLKAIAKAFGIQDKNIVYNAGEIVIFANGRTIQLTIGSKDAFVNGAKMTLANPAEIKAERTNVPVGDIARLLGVAVDWDGATKTATFSN